MDNPRTPQPPVASIGPSQVPTAIPRNQAHPELSTTDEDLARMLAAMDRDNYITDVEFERYRPLYDRAVAGKALSNPEMTPELNNLNELAEEFHYRFNLYKPIYVTDNNGNVLFALPALYRRLDTFDKEVMGNLLRTVFDGVVNDDNNANSVANINKSIAIAAIARNYNAAIDKDKLAKDEATFKSYFDDFHIRKYAEQYNMTPEALRELLNRYYAGEKVVFPWQQTAATPTTQPSGSTAPTSTDDGELPMDIFG